MNLCKKAASRSLILDFIMKKPSPDHYSRSIVILGDLNPKIFQPSWFAAENLIGKQAAEGAIVEVVHRDISIFSIDWMRIEVLRERFFAETTQQPYDEPLRDLVLGTFAILRHTPLRVMGINTTMEFRVDSEEKWNQAGHRLAPKEIWTGVLDEPGMTRMIMRESRRRDGRPGHVEVRIEPSVKVRPGLLISVNDHYQLDNSNQVMGSDEILQILQDAWSQATSRAEDIIYTMLQHTTS